MELPKSVRFLVIGAGVHGLSSGAVLALEAAVRGAAITKLVLFEPPHPPRRIASMPIVR